MILRAFSNQFGQKKAGQESDRVVVHNKEQGRKTCQSYSLGTENPKRNENEINY